MDAALNIRKTIPKIGDVTGDGYNDLLFTTNSPYGDARLHPGCLSMPDYPVKQWHAGMYGTGDFFGNWVFAVGDVNGDGVNDVAIGEQGDQGCGGMNLLGSVHIFAGDTSVYCDGTIADNNERTQNDTPGEVLFSTFPNPFNSEVTVSYTLPAAGEVLLSLYTVLGEKKAELLRAEKNTGTYEHHMSAEALGLASGVYFITMEFTAPNNEPHFITQKILYLK